MFSAILISAAACGGGVCQQAVVVRQKAVYAAPYVAPVVAPVYYFVGSAVRAEAIVQQQLNQDPMYAEFLRFKEWQANRTNEPVAAEPMQENAVQHFCAKCHGVAEPKGGYYLDGSPGMSAEAITKAIRMIASDKMPPPTSGHRLTREEKNALLTTLLSLEAGQDQPPPEPQPQGGEE